MSWMFSGCSNLTNLDISNFDTINVTNKVFMFYNCNSLQQIIVSEKANDTILKELNERGLNFEATVNNNNNTYTLTRKIKSK